MGRGSSKLGGLERKIDALQEHVMGMVYTPLNTLATFKEGAEVQNIWSDFKPTEKKIKKLPVEELSINEIYTWQKTVNKEGLLNMLNGDTPHSSDMPVAVKHNGKYVLVDGNHRAALAKLRGDKNINVRVFEG